MIVRKESNKIIENEEFILNMFLTSGFFIFGDIF